MLKKNRILFVFVFLLVFSVNASAREVKAEYDPIFAFLDVVVLRPLGLAGTVVGSAVFVGISPLTALASIAPPHDAFEKMGYMLVMTPYHFTFVRPVGINEWDQFKSPPNL